jgi:predicted HAD superfamily Cof-like phosphohydrolase
VMPSPALLQNKVMADRLEHLKEEVDEFGYANNMSDLPGCVDALIDTVYVALGTAIMMGLDENKFRECWLRVHQANMKKEVKKMAGHKFGVSKPAGWRSPELGDILNNG